MPRPACVSPPRARATAPPPPSHLTATATHVPPSALLPGSYPTLTATFDTNNNPAVSEAMLRVRWPDAVLCRPRPSPVLPWLCPPRPALLAGVLSGV